jgi:2-oxoglutarate/2-oxoacid ferredoxin oxidoreductase subunit beta
MISTSENTASYDHVNLTPNDYKSEVRPVWCPGCGDYSVLTSLYKAIAEMGIPPEQLAIASGIGCSGRLPAFINSYGLHGTHGRSLPLATGIKMAHPELVVIAAGGDGDAFSIGMGHFPHTVRRNMDITCIVMDNQIYGLTKGQPSPTSARGLEKKASPYGTIDNPIDPIQMALSFHATFVARGFTSKPKDLGELFKAAILHKGFSFVQVLSPCMSFNNALDYFKQITKPLPANHDPSDREQATKLAMSQEALYLGIFFQTRLPTYDELVRELCTKNALQDYAMPQIMERFMC